MAAFMTAVADFIKSLLHSAIGPHAFPGWKRIGWHLGKKLKDILHGGPRDSGPTKAERLAQRRRDILKAFAYFDHFEELEDWRPEDADPIQIANTPLLKRAEQIYKHVNITKTSKTILCHDYKGGYRGYEAIRPEDVEAEDYSCEYLQYIDTFIYFSHKLVCVPPPTWTNTLHRNGVKALGTFIVEPHSPSIDRMLRQCDGSFPLAKQLASMADVFGFDGWLLNIEKEFPDQTTDLPRRLSAFITDLKQHAGGDKLIVWYDALTVKNEVDYQNGLTLKNLPFAQAADALFTNYEWLPENVFHAREIAVRNGISTEEIHFGIDVWAQNTNMSGPPRVTYPPDRGGGTNTGVAVNALANLGFSTAIFAPAWTFEHFPGPSRDAAHSPQPGRLVEQVMWEGAKLPEGMECGCKKGIQQHRMDFQNHPITRHARQYTAGSSTYFETDFGRAYVSRRQEQSRPSTGLRKVPQLSTQSILPNLLPLSRQAWDNLPNGPSTRVIYGEILDGPEETGLAIYSQEFGHFTPDHQSHEPRRDPQRNVHRLRLFNLSMPTSIGLTARISYRRPRSSRSIKTGFYMAYYTPGSEGPLTYSYSAALHSSSSSSSDTSDTTTTQTIPIAYDNDKESEKNKHLVEIGTYIDDPHPAHLSPNPDLDTNRQKQQLLTLKHICILPTTNAVSHPIDRYEITDLRLINRSPHPDTAADTQTRLVWSYHPLAPSRSPATAGTSDPSDLPWSRTTGPFAYFVIMLNGEFAGRTCACAFPLRRGDFVGVGGGEKGEGEGEVEVEVCVEGVMFGFGFGDGDRVRSAVVRFRVGGSEGESDD